MSNEVFLMPQENNNAPKAMLAVAKAFSAGKLFDLRKISNEAAEAAAIGFNRDLAEISVAAYALHKTMTKEHIVKDPKWASARKAIEDSLYSSAKALQEGRREEFLRELKKVGEKVTQLDRRLGKFMQKTFEKARVKQASRAYAVGISLSQAASLMDTNLRQLQEYVGATTIAEDIKPRLSVRERLQNIKKILG